MLRGLGATRPFQVVASFAPEAGGQPDLACGGQGEGGVNLMPFREFGQKLVPEWYSLERRSPNRLVGQAFTGRFGDRRSDSGKTVPPPNWKAT